MKRIENLIKITFCVLLFSACESFIADDINLDPNNPSSVTLNAILPSIQIRHMDVYGGLDSGLHLMIIQDYSL